VNTLKTLCVAAVLSALGYGAYVTLTGRADPPEPPAAGDWQVAPQVSLPAENDPLTANDPPSMPRYLTAEPSESPGSTTPSSTAEPSFMPETPPPATDTATAQPSNSLLAAAASTGAPGVSIESTSPPSTPVATLTPEGIDTTTPVAADIHGEFVIAWSEAERMLGRGQLADALLALSEWVTDSRLGQADRTKLFEMLDQLAGTVVYSREHFLAPAYTVQAGDTLERIAERFGVTWQLLAKINGIADAQAIKPGDTLKVVQGPFDALITLHDFELTLFVYGRYAGRFRVGVGQDQSTPEGELVVQNKVENPTYYGPNQVIGPEDPSNPLGGRWIDLGNRLGIHGTNEPASIGKAESRGCIRLSPSDIGDVYDILSIGSRVTVVR
jgi:LysM repeat protein